MILDLSKDHTIALNRHGPKLWSYNGSKPDVVEAAVLEFLRSQGVDGYFTQRDNYLNLLCSLAPWPGKVTKRISNAFTGPHFVFYMGKDGWLPTHKHTFAKAMAELESITFERIEEKLHIFCEGKKYHRVFFSPMNPQPEYIIDFLRVLGIDKLRDIVTSLVSKDRCDAMRLLHDFDFQARFEWSRRDDLLTPEGKKLGATTAPLYWPAFQQNPSNKQNIEKTEYFASFAADDAIRQEILRACDVARKWRDITNSTIATTLLDLQVWDGNGTAIIEVKAPNDKLSQAQKNTIELARSRGERASLINVVPV